MAKNVTGRDPFGQGILIDADRANPIGNLNQSLTEVDVRLEVLKAELQAIGDAPALVADEAAIEDELDLEVSTRLDVRELRTKLDDLQSKMDGVRDLSLKWESDSKYLAYKKESEKLEKELADLKASVRKDLLKKRAIARAEDHDRGLTQKQQELASLEMQKKLLTAKCDEQLQQVKEGGAQKRHA